MLQLTYISTATEQVTDRSVDEILATSRLNNAAGGITGLLLYDGRRFLQALEGDAALVNAAFHRIKQDRRHKAVVMLSSKDVEERAFGNWAMAAGRASPTAGGRSIPEQVDALTQAVADPGMRALFRGFAEVRAAA